MAEEVHRSPGVSTTEIDLSGPKKQLPVGIPAGVIGTADEGPAFVPITIGSFADFIAAFGGSDGEKFGPLAVFEWLKNATSLTYIRVLGCGDGKQRDSSTGKVTNAGFKVGEKLIQANGAVGNNKYANGGSSQIAARTFFLGALHLDKSNSDYLLDAGVESSTLFSGSVRANPLLRGVLMAPRGINIMLSSSHSFNGSGIPGSTLVASASNVAATHGGAGMQGSMTGSVEIGSSEFVMLLNGHVGDDPASPSVITASFDMNSGMYFADVLNTDPFKIEEKGHYLYSHYDIHPAVCVVTGQEVIGAHFPQGLKNSLKDKVYEPIAFCTTGALGRDTSSSNVPNFESFEDRYTTAESPFVISQNFGGTPYELFKFVATDDGPRANTRVKVSIENIAPSNTDEDLFGSFDVVIRDFYDTDEEKIVIEQYRGVTLNQQSTRFVGRVVGDQSTFFDFDQSTRAQKLVVEGDYAANSNYIRLKLSDALMAGEIPDNALPMGYRGPRHLVTSGSLVLTNIRGASSRLAGQDAQPGGATSSGFGDGIHFTSRDWPKRTVEPPIPYRENITVGTDPTKTVNASFYWGIQTNLRISATEPNKSSVFNKTFESYSKFFPMFHPTNMNFSVGDNAGKADSSGTVLDSDKFNNNKFTLENLKIRTGTDGRADPLEWVSASYARNGTIATDATNKYRRFKPSDLNTVANRSYAKFTFFLQGGFNGTNIFEKDKSKLNNISAKREIDDSSNQGGADGSTIGSFRKAIDIMGEKSDVDIKLLAIPGMRHTSISDYAIDSVESRFDAMYIMDIEERDTLNNVVTSSADQSISVSNTVTDFKNRALNSSFAAAYFPDVVMVDPVTSTNVRCPPSVQVLGAFALNDSIGHPWFAPAGFTRGTLSRGLFASVDLNKSNMDDLYDADINPITDFPGTGLMVFGQKTLLATNSALDRVNVRRLLIEVRRQVRSIANTLLFEPNRQETLDKFSSLVNPVLQSIQERSGLDRFKVIIDSSTTTQADIENNTIRGKIFLQPTRTAEFISLDFVVTNTGAEI